MSIFRSAFDLIKKGLQKTAEVVGAQFRSLLLGRTLSEELIDEIETRLIAADVGVKAARELVAGLRKEFRSGTVARGEDALEFFDCVSAWCWWGRLAEPALDGGEDAGAEGLLSHVGLHRGCLRSAGR